VIAPQGPLEVALDPEGRFRGYAWFPLTLSRPPTPADVAAGIGAARDFLELALKRYPIDPKRLAILGFSQGGMVAYALALGAPKRFRALAALSTWLPDDLNQSLKADASGLEAWVQHGTRDEIVAVSRGRDSKAKLEARGVPLTYREYEMGHEITGESLGDLASWLDDRLRS
jgi:phospholipase/carboxylesterase